MAKGHSYAFKNCIIPFEDFQEAAKVLMERNMTDVLHDIQTEAIFMPETYLPTMPRVVDRNTKHERNYWILNT